jgi:hypothetical protein
MAEIKPILQALAWILGSMVAAWLVINIRDQLWPRQAIQIPYSHQAVFNQVEQVARDLEKVKAHVREVVSMIDL